MTPKETVQNYWRAWSEHNLDHLVALLAPGFVSRGPLSQGRPVGKDLIARGFKMLDKALPDLKEQVVSLFGQGDRIACEVIETATFTRPMEFPGRVINPTHRAYKLPVASFFRIDSQGLILEQRTYWDTANWAEQIGLDSKLFAPNSESPKPGLGASPSPRRRKGDFNE